MSLGEWFPRLYGRISIVLRAKQSTFSTLQAEGEISSGYWYPDTALRDVFSLEGYNFSYLPCLYFRVIYLFFPCYIRRLYCRAVCQLRDRDAETYSCV